MNEVSANIIKQKAFTKLEIKNRTHQHRRNVIFTYSLHKVKISGKVASANEPVVKEF